LADYRQAKAALRHDRQQTHQKLSLQRALKRDAQSAAPAIAVDPVHTSTTENKTTVVRRFFCTRILSQPMTSNCVSSPCQQAFMLVSMLACDRLSPVIAQW
jgi:hypothetical protein